MLDRMVAAEARPDYHIWIRFEDGLEGEVSVAHLVGRGVFDVWKDEAEFRKVFFDEESGAGRATPTPVRRGVYGLIPGLIPRTGSSSSGAVDGKADYGAL